MTTLSFTDATYVPPAGGKGREKTPSPFKDVISEIALKTDEKGKPVAKAFTFTHKDASTAEGAKDRDLAFQRYKRVLSETGADNTPAVTVRSVIDPLVTGKDKNGKDIHSKTESVVTFWTVKRVVHEKKPSDTPSTPAPAGE